VDPPVLHGSEGAVRWLAAFALTQIVEVPIYLRALARSPETHALSWRVRLAVAFGASVLTHPFVWFVFPRLHLGLTYVERSIAAEVFAWGFEMLWLQLFGVKRAWLWSLAANSASVAVFLSIRALCGWP
jgi:hypothetical protein